jgi:hypothetical protein
MVSRRRCRDSSLLVFVHVAGYRLVHRDGVGREIDNHPRLADAELAATGLLSGELASTVHRVLQLPDVTALRPRLQPESRVHAGVQADQKMSLTAGIADAVDSDERGRVEAVIDWKSDVDPTPCQIEIYRAQVRN